MPNFLLKIVFVRSLFYDNLFLRRFEFLRFRYLLFFLFWFGFQCNSVGELEKKIQIQQSMALILVGEPNSKSKYAPSPQEVDASIYVLEALESQNLITPEAIQNSVADYAALNQFTPQTAAAIDSEATAWANGNPIPKKVLTQTELQVVIEQKTQKMNIFYQNALADIKTISDDKLDIVRTNSYIGVYAYSLIKDSLGGLSDSEKKLIQENLNWLIRLRKESIDELARRGR